MVPSVRKKLLPQVSRVLPDLCTRCSGEPVQISLKPHHGSSQSYRNLITRSKKWLQKAATESIYMSEIIRSWMLQSSKEPSGMYLRMMIGICKERGQFGGTQIVEENMVYLSLLQLLLSDN